MRDLSAGPGLLSLNTATVKQQWNLAQAIEGCARHGIRGISPWRDKVAEMGLKKASAAIRAHGAGAFGAFVAPNKLRLHDTRHSRLEETTAVRQADHGLRRFGSALIVGCRLLSMDLAGQSQR